MKPYTRMYWARWRVKVWAWAIRDYMSRVAYALIGQSYE